ncbi:MAG: hypothetical protein K2M34_02410 [Alphaproteobacteria bacterium]|nr:hypothetical protein [Alphaproteobacteria bacterium]
MPAPIPTDRKVEILTYARDNGVNAAARHFNIPHATIGRWNRELKIYTPQTREYPMEKRREVLNYVVQHGVKAATEHFGVSRGIIERWNKELNVYKSSQRKFTREQKLEMLYYARDFGVSAAADKYDVLPSQIVTWNNQLHVYQMQKEYTVDEIKKILMFAESNGMTAAEREFNVPANTIKRWNREYKLYTPRRVPNHTEYSEPERIELLNRARQYYDAMPIDDRSANQAFIILASECSVTVDQLSKWNRKYKIVPRRTHVRANPSQADIDEAQSALNAARGHVARASRQSGIPETLIEKMVAEKKISFNRGRDKILTNPPVGRRKAGAIAGIIQMLQWNAQNQAKK